MPCYLLHMIAASEQRPYEDPNVKDLVGEFPRLFCAQCTPPKPLKPSESALCLQREAPCWSPGGMSCPEG